MTRTLREVDKLRKPRMSTSSRSKLTSKRLLMKFTQSNSPSRSTKLKLLDLRKSKRPELPESNQMRESNKDLEVLKPSWHIQISELKALEKKRPTSSFTSTTLSLRMFTPENSPVKDKISRKRKTSRPNWPELSKENKKFSTRKSLKLSKLPTRKTMVSSKNLLKRNF
jgi:hypothetical protein